MAVWIWSKPGSLLPNHLFQAIEAATTAACGGPDDEIKNQRAQPPPWSLKTHPAKLPLAPPSLHNITSTTPDASIPLTKFTLNVFRPTSWCTISPTTLHEASFHGDASTTEEAYGAVMWDTSSPAFSFALEKRNNNAAETMALCLALQGAHAKNYITINITTDSEVAISVFLKVCSNIHNDAWWYSQELMFEAQAIEAVIRKIETAAGDVRVIFNVIKVESHTATFGNEMADQLANYLATHPEDPGIDLIQVSTLGKFNLLPITRWDPTNLPFCLEPKPKPDRTDSPHAPGNKVNEPTCGCMTPQPVMHPKNLIKYYRTLKYQGFFKSMESLLGNSKHPIPLSRHHVVSCTYINNARQKLLMKLRADIWPTDTRGNKIVACMLVDYTAIQNCPFCHKKDTSSKSIGNLEHVFTCPNFDSFTPDDLPWPQQCDKDRRNLLSKMTPRMWCALTLGVLPNALLPIPTEEKSLQSALNRICNVLLKRVATFSTGPSKTKRRQENVSTDDESAHGTGSDTEEEINDGNESVDDDDSNKEKEAGETEGDNDFRENDGINEDEVEEPYPDEAISDQADRSDNFEELESLTEFDDV